MTKHDIDTENDNKCMVSIGLKVNKDQDMKTVNMGQYTAVGHCHQENLQLMHRV